MQKLRLLLFENCNRKCEGCCNKYWDLASLPVCTDFSGYDTIMLTGGEPMLDPYKVWRTVCRIRYSNLQAAIYLYTAKVDDTPKSLFLLSMLDGMTVTLHEQSDLEPWKWFAQSLDTVDRAKSLRLNVFAEVELGDADTCGWDVRDSMVWDTDCPLPDNEVLMRLA